MKKTQSFTIQYHSPSFCTSYDRGTSQTLVLNNPSSRHLSFTRQFRPVRKLVISKKDHPLLQFQ
ncbi:MAG TPA: hypothetical protein PKL83_03790 [bacterium]|nr:hypothetical protein [bacterium]